MISVSSECKEIIFFNSLYENKPGMTCPGAQDGTSTRVDRGRKMVSRIADG